MPGMAMAEDVEPHSLRKLYQKSLKRTYELFLSNRGERPAPDPLRCLLTPLLLICNQPWLSFSSSVRMDPSFSGVPPDATESCFPIIGSLRCW